MKKQVFCVVPKSKFKARGHWAQSEGKSFSPRADTKERPRENLMQENNFCAPGKPISFVQGQNI